MIEVFIYIACSAALLFLGYLVSVYSNTIYVDPEDIHEIFPDLSDRRRQKLEKFISNPRVFFQISMIVQISASLLLGMLSALISIKFSDNGIIPQSILFLIIALCYWIVAVVSFIYLPRRISIDQAKSKLVKFLPLVNFIYVITSPAINAFSKISTSGHTGEIPEEQKDDIVERAIETLAESAGIREPIIEEDEKEMIHQIFQLDVTEVEEIMVPRIRITGIEKQAKLGKIRDIIATHGFSRYPVFTGSIDNITGILYVKDLLLLGEADRKEFSLEDHTREPLVVGERKKIDQLLAEFKRTKKHLAIVIDEFGGTSGLVTLEDILEEIVGEIEDEHDPEQFHDIIKLDNGSFEVSGACPLEELAKQLDIEFQQEEFETVGGMIYDKIGSVPTEGTSLTWQHCRLTIQKIDGQRINKILVIPNQH